MDEEKKYHIDLIQNIISRMAKNSFALKGWAVTLLTGIFLFASKEYNVYFIFIALIPLISFWCLDSYYLQTERRYRVLYLRVTSENVEKSLTLKMPEPSRIDKTRFIQVFFSKTEILFYALLIVSVIIGFFISKFV